MTFIYNMADTWNNGGTTFNAIKMNVTDTASAANSNLMDLRVGTSKKFSIGKAGDVSAYNVLSDDTNYERFRVRWNGANELFIGTEKGGTGVNRTMFLQSTANIVFQINGANDVWSFSSSGHFIAGVDDTYDIGASGATRPRNGYFSSSVVAPTFQTPDTTVAALPAAGAGNKGQRRHVTDATATTFASTVVGGGANVVPVFSNGTNWIIG